MAFSRIQGASNTDTNNTSTIACTLSAGAGTGNMIIGIVSWNDGATLNSVTDNASGGSNTYALETTILDSGNNQSSAAFHCANIHGSPTVITGNLSGNELAKSIAVDEFSGQQQQNDARDSTAHGGNQQTNPATTTDAVTSGTFTTTVNGDLIWGGSANCSGAGNDLSTGTNFTTGQVEAPGGVNSASLFTEFRTQSTAGSGTAATYTNNVSGNDYTTFMIAILAPTAAQTPITAGFFIEDTTLQRQPQNQRMMKPDPQFATPAQPLPVNQNVGNPTAAGTVKTRMIPC